MVDNYFNTYVSYIFILKKGKNDVFFNIYSFKEVPL